MKKLSILGIIAAFMLVMSAVCSAQTFTDVPTDNWAYNAVDQLEKAGLIEGYGDNTFGSVKYAMKK